VLYVLSECIHTNGYLTAFAVDPATGAVTQLAPPLEMTGKSSCYISFDSDASHAVVANYFDGRLDVVVLDTRSGAPLAVVQSHQQTRRASWRQVVDREVGLRRGRWGGRGAEGGCRVPARRDRAAPRQWSGG
jgi:6-phosphogluconolactonase (cycloisomerase 2 family)